MTLAGPAATTLVASAPVPGSAAEGGARPTASAAAAPARTAPPADPLAGLPLGVRLADRGAAWRDRLFASPKFQRWAARVPVVRLVARQRARAVFDLVAGFAYSQTVAACVQSGLLTMLADGPVAEGDLVERLALPPDGAARLLRAAAALKLVERRAAGRWGLGTAGGPLLASPGLAQMVEHNALLYDELRDPLAHLRRAPGEASALSQYWPYVDAPRRAALGAADVSGYSALMTATVSPVADELLDAVPLGQRRRLLDVGGGEGAFVLAAARRHPGLACTMFDLPAVAARARRRIADAGLGGRVTAVGGDFERDALPAADVVTLVRVCLDHGDDTVLTLLRAARAALAPGGMVVVAEPLAGVPGAEAVADVYFAYYLRAMGRGRARSADEFRALFAEAGFRRVRVRPTRYPVVAGVLTAEV
jgi:demethylspheroidene O-methyltransferase